MSIERSFPDRDECLHDGTWCVFEIINVTCPICNEGTNVVVTYPDYSEYHHDMNDVCRVFWTKEPQIPGFEHCTNLISMPGYMRDKLDNR